MFFFDGLAVGGHLGGRFTKRVDGKKASGGPFRGTIAPLPLQQTDHAIYYLELHRAVVGGRQLLVQVPCVERQFRDGVAFSGAWNHNYHDVAPAGLKLDGDALRGEVRVTMNPDPYVPKDKKPVPAAYAIDARVIDGRIIQGTYRGTFGSEKLNGRMFGELAAVATIPEPVSVGLKLDDAVNGGAPWFRRVYVSFVAAGGRAHKGQWHNNKGGWQGTFQQAEVKFHEGRLTATLEGTVDRSATCQTGRYTFKLAGRVVGTQLIGRCDTYRDGQLTKSNTAFMGSFGPVK